MPTHVLFSVKRNISGPSP